MEKLWFKELGFFNNPFSVKPAAFSTELYGYDINEIFDKINNGEVIFIEGDYGKGKTAILKKLIREFGGKNKLIYYSCNRIEDSLDVNKLLKERPSFLSKLFRIIPKDIILLLDEVQDLNKDDSENLTEYYNKNFKSIVLVSKDYNKINFGDGLKELIGKNIIKLKKLTDEDAINIVRKRIGDIKILSDEIIKQIAKKSDNNPRKLLRNCEEVCRYAVNQGDDIATKEHIKEVLE